MTISFEPAHGQLALTLRRRELEAGLLLRRRKNHLHVVHLFLVIGADVILNFLLEIVQILDDLGPTQATLQDRCLTCKQANKHPLT